MIQFISQKTVTFMCRYYKVDNTDMLDVYQYGIEITLSSLLNISLVFIISLLLGDFLEGIVFLVCFIPLRSYCGGYHASTYFICNIVFAMTFIGVCFISKMLFDCLTENNLAIYEVIMLLSFLPILKYSPVKNIHKKLDRIKAKKCRIISFAVYLLICIISMLLINAKIIYGTIMIITLSSVAIMVMVEILMQRRGFHEVQNYDG